MLCVVVWCLPGSVKVINSRWRFFSHVLRMNEDCPTRQAMTLYFEGKDVKGRYFVCMKQSLAFEVRTMLASSK